MAEGFKPNQVAAILNKSVKTTLAQSASIYKKLNITTGDRHIGLVRMAIRRGWLQEGVCSEKS